MKGLLKSIVLSIVLVAALTPAWSQGRTYLALNSDVPFKFRAGKKTFNPGTYQFIVVGSGLVAMRDSHHKVLARLLTRSVPTDTPSSAARLVFHQRDKRLELAEIWLENKDQMLQVLGEDLALVQPQISVPWPMDMLKFGDARFAGRFH